MLYLIYMTLTRIIHRLRYGLFARYTNSRIGLSRSKRGLLSTHADIETGSYEFIKVYIWPPSGWNVGHAALELPNNSSTDDSSVYISWWVTQSPPDVWMKKLLRHACSAIQYPFLYFSCEPGNDVGTNRTSIRSYYTRLLGLLGCQRYKDNSNLKNWVIGNSCTTGSLEEDVSTKKGSWPVAYFIPVTTEVSVDKMVEWWMENKKGTFIVLGNNCCNKVVGALRAGGVYLRTSCLSMWKPSTLAITLDEYFHEQMEAPDNPEELGTLESVVVDVPPKLRKSM